MSDQLKPGDVVELKSGGPTMTIDEFGSYGGEQKAKCVWFAGDDRKIEVFALHTLKKAEEQD